ncbi:hypothetical protein PoB_004025400 [Plakobranchus ocellatus]|uniref:Uncharacterized protein n=1 Tax=Plakobranchus ocellatus TaxID=259542 RepID=A0AAV4B4Y1_9GAST|nr:hypothetical protein PoB_004025400 [Plakobranchus ocellatus]
MEGLSRTNPSPSISNDTDTGDSSSRSRSTPSPDGHSKNKTPLRGACGRMDCKLKNVELNDFLRKRGIADLPTLRFRRNLLRRQGKNYALR